MFLLCFQIVNKIYIKKKKISNPIIIQLSHDPVIHRYIGIYKHIIETNIIKVKTNRVIDSVISV